ncbi:MAG: hypothetical protein IKJ43_00485 [Bacilli bacterium]|nr:hypothetical protein [Bacilli bacterium]
MNSRMKKNIGKNIKYYLLMVYIKCHPVYKEALNERGKYIKEISMTVSKVDKAIKSSKLNIPEEICTLIGYLLTFLVLKFLLNIKNVALMIILILIIGAFIGIGLSKILSKLSMKNASKELKNIEEEKNEIISKLSSIKEGMSGFDNLLSTLMDEIKKNAKGLKLEYETDEYFFYFLYLYVILDTEEVSDVTSIINKLKESVTQNSKVYNPYLDVQKGEKFDEYFIRNIKEVNYELPKDYVDKFMTELPFIKDHQKEIDGYARDCYKILKEIK